MKAQYLKNFNDQGLHSMPRRSVHPNAGQTHPQLFQGHSHEVELDKWT